MSAGKNQSGHAEYYNVSSRGVSMFPTKLFNMFMVNPDPEVFTWDDAGKTIIIKNVNKFKHQIIPQHFEQKKFESFVRQVRN
jgi:hypothetical protein